MTAMLTASIFLIAGLMLLVKGADWLVDGAASVARRLRVAPIVIGLTIVAFGTSAPELVVNLVASFSGNADIAIGNVIGSNIANILLILGIAASITPLAVKRNTTWKEIPLALLASLLVLVMTSDRRLAGGPADLLDRIDGIVLLAFFAVFMYYTFGIAKAEGEPETIAVRSVPLSVAMIAGGLLGLAVGGKLAVDGAIAGARILGVSERVIGLTVVAIGTSLPELVTSAMAAIRKHADIAIGNVVGSNIFNVFWILGISATIKPLPFSEANLFDAAMAIAASLLLFFAMFVGKRHTLERWQAGGFIAVYAGYVGLLVLG